MTPPYRILVIDDNPAIHQDFQKIFDPKPVNSSLLHSRSQLFGEENLIGNQQMTFKIDTAEQGQIGHAMVQHAIQRNKPYSVAFVDMRMPPGWDGVETIEHIWGIDPHLQMVICTAYSDHDWEQVLERLHNSDKLLVLRKPFEPIEVKQLAISLTERWINLQDTRQRLNDLAAFQEERERETQEAIQQLEQEAQQRQGSLPHANSGMRF